MDKTYVFDNLNIDIESGSLNIIIWGICLGIAIGLFLQLICRTGAGSFISSLIKSGAADEASAKTVDEISPQYKWLVKFLLANPKSSLHKTVLCANRDDYANKKICGLKKFYYEKFLKDSVPVKLTLKTAKFYLPEEKRIGAEVKYPTEKNPVLTFVIGLIILIGVALFLSFAVPELLTMLDNFITSVKS